MKKNNINEIKYMDRFTYLKNIAFDQRDLRCDGAKFQIVKFKPYTDIKPHFHKKTSEIFYIREGCGILGLNGERIKCKKDDFFLCEPFDVHEFINDTDDEFVILIFKTNEIENDIYWNV